jgi:hypothetical protein
MEALEIVARGMKESLAYLEQVGYDEDSHDHWYAARLPEVPCWDRKPYNKQQVESCSKRRATMK